MGTSKAAEQVLGIFMRFVLRFTVFALLTGEVEAVLSGRLAYRGLSGAVGLGLAALLATADHYLTFAEREAQIDAPPVAERNSQ